MKKKIITLIMAVTLASSMCMTSFAGEWKWQDIDGNDVAECYYYDDEFYNSCDDEFQKAMHFWNMTNVNKTIRTTPDGYQINAARQWIKDGVVQTQKVEIEKPAVNTNIAYNPAYPLERYVDAWNLKLIDVDFETGTIGTVNTIYSWNVQAMLTNQMDKYKDPIVRLSVPLVDGYYSYTEHGTIFHIREEDYLKGKRNEQAIYEWFCNWLNGMDFENMSEMERAQAISDVFKTTTYDDEWANADMQNEIGRDNVYAVLIDKKGVCQEYAMTAMSLAKAVNLKSAVYGSGNHACYFIQVDGLPYRGDNGFLQLKYSYYDYETTPDYISIICFTD